MSLFNIGDEVWFEINGVEYHGEVLAEAEVTVRIRILGLGIFNVKKEIVNLY